MTKQIIFIHGGKTFPTYQRYINSLKDREVTSKTFKANLDWTYFLGEKLGTDFEVFNPRMPNGYNAVYEEWKIWIERMEPFLKEDVILIGHSLGGIFLAKYLSENTFARRIKAVILLSAPFHDLDAQRVLSSFTLPESLENLEKQAGKIYLIHSMDDPVVPFEHVQRYKEALVNSQLLSFNNRQHFNQESFDEIVDLIKSI